MEAITPYLNVEVAGICLLIGSVIKTRLDFVNNNYIPIILSIIGIVLNIGLNNDISFNICLSGFVSGLMSTSVHQLYKTTAKSSSVDIPRQ